ncbi:hypothetical protein FBT96_02695 [Rhodobacter capsulatus]|uniref:NnrS family protein n=1 Tax=Rhodobacter capsulatus TaxID=1061 RepID=A0A4U1K2F7_RHOCA|nr:NnrS family protein [Rhodobacter capsulatus]TKD25270.1 hypothetical protein FBT96_02695 [Rhodobacter capsulatus]
MSGAWRAPHLPLFLLAALWAGLVPLVWLWPGLSCDPAAWHQQELMLGFVGAAMGGYLLTALPHWLKDAGMSVSGVPPLATLSLVAAWVIGRLAGGSCQPDGVSLAGLALYPFGLTLCLVLPVGRAGAWSRLPIALAPLVLLLIAVRLRLAADGLTAVLGLTFVVAVVGGRIIPAFLAARANDRKPRRRMPWDNRLADGALASALALHLAGAGEKGVGALLLAAAFGQAARMRRWDMAPLLRGHRDIALLLCAWLWLPLGLGLVGAGLLGMHGLPMATAVHALTTGLMGSMILAVMARAWMRREPGELRPGPLLCAAFVLIQLTAVLRLTLTALAPSALCWSAGWTLSAIAATQAFYRPLNRPILSAGRAAGSSPRE